MKKLMVAAMISMVFAPLGVSASEIEHRGSGLTEAQKKEQSRNEDRQRAARASGIAGIYMIHPNQTACKATISHRGAGCNDAKNQLRNEMIRDRQTQKK